MSKNALLSDEERARFADYLEQDAMDSEAIAEQIEKVGGPMMAELAKRERLTAAAARLIAKRLRSTHSETVSR